MIQLGRGESAAAEAHRERGRHALHRGSLGGRPHVHRPGQGGRACSSHVTVLSLLPAALSDGFHRQEHEGDAGRPDAVAAALRQQHSVCLRRPTLAHPTTVCLCVRIDNQCSTPHSVLEHMPPDFKGGWVPGFHHSLVLSLGGRGGHGNAHIVRGRCASLYCIVLYCIVWHGIPLLIYLGI